MIAGNHELTRMNTKFNQTTDYTEYTDFLPQIASPQEPTMPEEFMCEYEI